MSEDGRASASGLKNARDRLAAAKDDRERSGWRSAMRPTPARALVRTGASIAYWLRAMRIEPNSVEIVVSVSGDVARASARRRRESHVA